MAQVYTFTDSNGEVRLMAEIDPAPGGGSLPDPILDPVTITPTDGTVDPLTVSLQFAERFVFGTNGGNENQVYFEDASSGRPFQITDSSIHIGNGSFIAPNLTVADGAIEMTLPSVGKVFRVTDGTNEIFRVDHDGSVHIKTGTTIIADL